MKVIISILMLVIIVLPSRAQQHDYNWIFGVYTYPDEPNANGNIINFSGDTVNIEGQEELHVFVYPNPSAGELFLDIDQYLGSDTEFRLYDLQGREQYRLALSGEVGSTQIRLPDLSSGMYIYSIYSAGRLLHSDKLVME
jgi:hypothetical protein